MKINVEMTEDEFMDYMDYKNKKWDFKNNLSYLSREFIHRHFMNNKEVIIQAEFEKFVREVRELGTRYFEVRND